MVVSVTGPRAANELGGPVIPGYSSCTSFLYNRRQDNDAFNLLRVRPYCVPPFFLKWIGLLRKKQECTYPSKFRKR